MKWGGWMQFLALQTMGELFSLLAILLSISAIAVFVLAALFGFQKLPLEFLISFAADLVFLHFWMYFLRDWHSKSVANHIDYLYLSVGALGLLITVADYSNRNYVDAVKKDYEVAINHLQTMEPGILLRLQNACEGPGLRSKECNDMDSIRVTFLEMINSIRSNPDLDSFEMYLIWVRVVQRDVIKLDNPEKAFLAPEVVNLRQILASEGDSYKDNYIGVVLNKFRYHGFFLLSAALALRITKVTVDLRKWYRP